MPANKRSDPGIVSTFELSGHFTKDDKFRDDYAYLPFEVPAGVTRLDVSYDYARSTMAQARADDENVLDLGVFSPQPREAGRDGEAPGVPARDNDVPVGPGGGGQHAGGVPGERVTPGVFRGWSGGARSGFFISANAATPGYLAGEIPAGTWHVFLGLYKIATTGCDYTVTVTLSSTPQPAADPDGDVSFGGVGGDAAGRGTAVSERRHGRSGRPGAGDPASRWYVGDLQAHTHHSDAKASVAHIAGVAADRGLDFLAITDHNTTSQLRELAANSGRGLLLMPGMEITTYYGHANVWGLSEWIDFRCRSAEEFPRCIEAAHAQRSVISANHPYTDCAWTYGWIDGLDAIEVWWALWNRGNVATIRWWDSLLSAGKRITGVGGSDRHEPAEYDPHFPHQVGTPATWVRARELSTTAVLEAIRRGRVSISESPVGPTLEMTVALTDGTKADIGAALSTREGDPITVECHVTRAGNDTVQIVGDGEVIATQPVRPGSESVVFAFTAGPWHYLRAQLVEGHRSSLPEGHYPVLRALTNPIYLGTGAMRGVAGESTN